MTYYGYILGFRLWGLSPSPLLNRAVPLVSTVRESTCWTNSVSPCPNPPLAALLFLLCGSVMMPVHLFGKHRQKTPFVGLIFVGGRVYLWVISPDEWNSYSLQLPPFADVSRSRQTRWPRSCYLALMQRILIIWFCLCSILGPPLAYEMINQLMSCCGVFLIISWTFIVCVNSWIPCVDWTEFSNYCLISINLWKCTGVHCLHLVYGPMNIEFILKMVKRYKKNS